MRMRRKTGTAAALACVVLLLVSSLSLGQSPDSSSGKSGGQSVKGQLMMLAGEVAIIRDRDGKATHVPVSKATKIDKGLKDGDMVEATLGPDGQAVAIKSSQ